MIRPSRQSRLSCPSRLSCGNSIVLPRRSFIRAGAGLAAIIAAGRAPAAFIRSMLAARNGLAVSSGGAEPPTPGPAYWGLCFTAAEPGVVINMAKDGTPPAVTLETSPDGETWTTFDGEGGTTPITLAAAGDKIYFRAGSGGNSGLSSSITQRHRFTLSGGVYASGSIMSLLDGLNSLNKTLSTTYAFVRLFYGQTKLITAPDLPATVLSSNCYNSMFSGCTSLVSVSCAFTAWGSSPSWLSNVAASGTFYCPTALGTDATIRRGTSYCPNGWTVINTD